MNVNQALRKFHKPVTNKQKGKMDLANIEKKNVDHCLAYQDKQGNWVWNETKPVRRTPLHPGMEIK